jgi:hypothetical protein
MSDLSILVAASVFFLILVGAGVVWFRRHQLEVRKLEATETVERRRKESEEKTKLRERVEAGTHLESGQAKCRTPGCPREAGHCRAHVVQDELSLRAWVRRRFGAPRRYEAVLGGSPDYCATCSVLGSQVVEHALSQSSERIANLLLDEDGALAHLESDGVDARVADLIADHRARASVPPASSQKPSQIRRVIS